MTENDQQPFSEEAALRELEELQRAIEQSRVRRRAANDAFDRFLRSFDRHEPAAPPPSPAPAEVTAIIPPRPSPAARPAAAPAAFVAPPSSPDPEPEETLVLPPMPSPFQTQPLTAPPADSPPHPGNDPAPAAAPERHRTAAGFTEPLQVETWEHQTEPATGTAAFPAESDVRAITEAAGSAGATAPTTLPRQVRPVPAALTSGVSRRARRTSLAIPLSAVLVVGAAGFFLWRAKTPALQAPTEPASVAVAPARPQPPPASAAAALPAPTAEVSTVRRVWVRVMVDGQRVIERELPADARIPLTPTSQVVIRAGDAGAVRVAIAGKDQGPVGRDGEVATRSFMIAASSR